ncbi:MAG: Tetratricopeptide repeat protein, partial [Parcubacteria group bacterium GW2011_GWA2_40_8]
MSSAITKGLAMISLIIMLVLGATSMFGDSLTVDEDPHIGSGISYLTQKDMRLNPEHPPLMKDLAALPLLFVKDLKVPTEHRSWTEDINGQWDFGREFIFWAGNNANLVVFLSRIMPLVMTVILGWFVFKASLELAGAAGGLVAIILYTFSPVILAHGRLVTTDVPAALGAFIATYFLLKYLFKPSQKG